MNYYGYIDRFEDLLTNFSKKIPVTLTRPIGLPPHAPVAQKIAELCTLIASMVKRLSVRVICHRLGQLKFKFGRAKIGIFQKMSIKNLKSASKKIDSFTLETSKNNLICKFLRNEPLRAKKCYFNDFLCKSLSLESIK